MTKFLFLIYLKKQIRNFKTKYQIFVKIFLRNYKKIMPFYNYAYLKFSYSDSYFKPLKSTFYEKKYCTINIGDYIQSFAIKKIYENLNKHCFSMDRDTCSKYKLKPIKLFCNAIFYPNNVPSTVITPIFLGFSLADTPDAIIKYKKILNKYSPIGCRDLKTYYLLKENNISAFISGCYSITLPTRKNTPKVKKIFFVGISEELKKHIPEDLLPHSEFINQRKKQYNFPLNEDNMEDLENEAIKLIERYKNEATLVVSPLLHCISPCIGMGIPVILARDEYNERFSSIKQLTKLYLKEEYNSINWTPEPIDITTLKQNMLEIAKCKINNKKISTEQIDYFNNLYLNNP